MQDTTFVDMFSGAGLFSAGAVQAGINLGLAGTYNLLGTSPGFAGGIIGRAGTPVGYVNAGANLGFNTPPLYDLDCESE